MAADELDLSRLDELEDLLGQRPAEIVRTLVGELERALGALSDALQSGDLATAALAAHAARNSALMIDSRPLLTGLDGLERAARDDDLAAARSAHEGLTHTWPAVRRALQRAADAGGRGS